MYVFKIAGTIAATMILGWVLGCGSGSVPQTSVPVPSGSAPTAAFSTVPSTPVAGQPIYFTDISTGSPTSWQWNFGDGATSTAQNTAHAYNANGFYTAVLSAANSAGSSTESQLVTVLQASNGTALNGSIVLGAPEDTSITLSILTPDQSGSISIQYGTVTGSLINQTQGSAINASVPLLLTLTGLTPNSQYFYRVLFRSSSGEATSATPEYRFHTARALGSTYTFTVQADSHLDGNTDFSIYLATLANIGNPAADFHVDLGDTFMCEKNSAPFASNSPAASNQATVNARYIYDRDHYKIITASTPLFLVNGNHEGEAGWANDGTANNLAIWTTRARQKYFLNPVADRFYSSEPTVDPIVGQRASSYAWQWGDALFIVLDPFWYTKSNPGGNSGWNLTLGKAQYDWLEQTLMSSNATFKFVFLHNLVGGLQSQMRGGAEAAPYYEWGGKNADGTDGFSQYRSGWTMPIHQLMVKYRVTAVFHGHDHLYDHQSLDGIIYQEVPQPCAINSQSGPNLAAQYGYTSGTILSSSGYLRVTVRPKSVVVQYIRTWLPANETSTQHNGEIADSYTIAAP